MIAVLDTLAEVNSIGVVVTIKLPFTFSISVVFIIEGFVAIVRDGSMWEDASSLQTCDDKTFFERPYMSVSDTGLEGRTLSQPVRGSIVVAVNALGKKACQKRLFSPCV